MKSKRNMAVWLGPIGVVSGSLGLATAQGGGIVSGIRGRWQGQEQQAAQQQAMQQQQQSQRAFSAGIDARGYRVK